MSLNYLLNLLINNFCEIFLINHFIRIFAFNYDFFIHNVKICSPVGLGFGVWCLVDSGHFRKQESLASTFFLNVLCEDLTTYTLGIL